MWLTQGYMLYSYKPKGMISRLLPPQPLVNKIRRGIFDNPAVVDLRSRHGEPDGQH